MKDLVSENLLIMDQLEQTKNRATQMLEDKDTQIEMLKLKLNSPSQQQQQQPIQEIIVQPANNTFEELSDN